MTMGKPNGNLFLMSQVAFRIVAVAATGVAIFMLLKSDQTVLMFGTEFIAKYTSSAGLRFQLGIDVVVCAFSLLSLIGVYAVRRSKTSAENYFYLLLHDVVMMMAILSGCAAGTAVGVVALYGQEQSGWMPICNQVGKFCDKVMLSIVLSIVALACYAVLSFITAYKLKSLAQIKLLP